MLECFNYDGSYLHSSLPTFSSEDHANFKEGDTVVFRDTFTGNNLLSGETQKLLLINSFIEINLETLTIDLDGT